MKTLIFLAIVHAETGETIFENSGITLESVANKVKSEHFRVEVEDGEFSVFSSGGEFVGFAIKVEFDTKKVESIPINYSAEVF